MLARAIEETGLPTVTIALIREHAQRVKPPRTLWVPFPFGFALGNPDDPPFQQKVLSAALGLLSENDTPVLAEFPEDADAPPVLLQASAAQAEAANSEGDPADEVTALRGYYERWVDEHEGRTMVGLQRQCRSGSSAASFATCRRSPPERKRHTSGCRRGSNPYGSCASPQTTSRRSSWRRASPSVRMITTTSCNGGSGYEEVSESETAMGNLIASVASRLAEQGNEQAAWGIAR